jgi:alkylation response protein AidB-like acyl-CoA dehydrogenase/flavin-dependent dehydrogenase/electron transfer flavoprotein alpha subunit/ferredoxin-like protein FixX
MSQYKFDVIIVGAGPAGITAAGVLANAGISVALLEAGAYAGAENWSGCVYFTESLAENDCFGQEAVESAPFERRVTRRGTLMHNGLDVVGVELTNPDAFKNCYTVLRPVYDPYYAHLARGKGAVHITETTVFALLRKSRRVVGVQTNRGPLHADIVFIAEGDASHLVRSEQLERVSEPHYLQGVKAVLSLQPSDIERRFKLKPSEGCAYELLIRNAAIAGKTAKLNISGFLYTNRNSLSLGYVIPLDSLKNHYHGDHDRLFEWVRGLPYIKELAGDAELSAYGTKLIRSGGWTERPVLVEDGLAVGGASVGIGIDIPFPNFTGPASATGLYFGRAVKAILGRGRTPDAKNLGQEYLAPLQASVYGQNAQYLSAWPKYFGSSSTLFGRTIDIVCGSAHFLSSGSYIQTGRFLRNHIASWRGLRESLSDNLRMIRALRLWKPIIISVFNPATVGNWIANIFKRTPTPDPMLGILLRINNRTIDPSALAWPVNAFIRRLSPAVLRALKSVYSNNGQTMDKKFSKAVLIIIRGMKLSDLIILPLFGASLFLISLGTAVWDAFRFYVLKTPADKFLIEPVMAYSKSQKKARDLDAIKPRENLEAKLASNTYHVGSLSHIKTLWPNSLAAQPEMSKAALWWVCPARVYVYDAPLTGRGKVTVNYENCIKCETCWRTEPGRTLWGRHTDHKLIFRPESGAISLLLDSLLDFSSGSRLAETEHANIRKLDDKIWYLSDKIRIASLSALNAASAFMDAVKRLPSSADKGRKAWPLMLGKRLTEKLEKLAESLSNDGRKELSQFISSEKTAIDLRLMEQSLFHTIYRCRTLEQRLLTWTGLHGVEHPWMTAKAHQSAVNISYEEASFLFPDHVVKRWEEEPLTAGGAATLHAFIAEHSDSPHEAIRALSAVSPALGLIAAHQFSAIMTLKAAGILPNPGICAVAADPLMMNESSDSVRIQGTLHLVPLAACHTLLLIAGERGNVVPLSTTGVTITSTPAIGFRAAALSDVTLDCIVDKNDILVNGNHGVPGALFYLAVALGAADYLSRRALEHATGRIQFPGQMLDTEGRDGIAKLGAVKAMISRIEGWRLLLKTLFVSYGELNAQDSNVDLLYSTLAATAFSPEHGSLGYDAGQVFGGFAYSEDDLLSRFYRDSALFRFLSPGYGAAASLHALLRLSGRDGFSFQPNLSTTVQGEPLGRLARQLEDLDSRCIDLREGADPLLAGQARALAIGIRIVLDSVERELESGTSSEAEAAAAEVLLVQAETALRQAQLSVGRGRVSPSALFPSEPSCPEVALDSDYETFCTSPGVPHASGSFLKNVFDRSPRFVPEIQLHDPRLRALWLALTDWFKRNCRDNNFGGLSIERAIERDHRVPDEVITAIKEHKWLATYIPQAESGLGWHKAEYYILNSAAGTFGDAAINLLIMASTSIGTTPILLGLEDELPRVNEELAPLAHDSRQLDEIGTRIEGVIKSFSSPDSAWIRKEFDAIMKLIDERIRHTRVVKYLSANFLRAFYSASIAGQRGDINGFVTGLKHTVELFKNIMPDVRAALDELPRRERCHKLFLSYLGHGGVSAFALTEPTAGSDSGGVKTTARLSAARLTQLDDGRYSFLVDEADEKSVRFLIHADRLLFTDQGIAYRTPDEQPSLILYDRYDYTTDKGVRYFLYKGNICEFHDICQPRVTGSGLVYEYYRLTGAKMWITNGSIATQFCLFALTEEGVTGFLVDRHSEGLKVGADEKKMGQRGSPTNEISIDNVRVPREAVIGYEGHGQVNALETLNVGRCGLAVVSGALMHKLLDEAGMQLVPSPDRDKLLGEAAAILFGSESLAFYLIGLFDRPHESVRMESAIAKYACSEDIHELLSLVEYAFGPQGQTEHFLLEKARRDARILTIYEGTNEVQRFLILRDLIAQAQTWPELTAQSGDRNAQLLTEWKNGIRSFVKEAGDLLGDASWSDALFQPALFPLAEMAGEVLRLECIYYRMEWLDQRRALLAESDPKYVPSLLIAGERAAERTIARLATIKDRFKQAWEQVKENIDLAEVRAADAALDRAALQVEKVFRSSATLKAQLRILCILRPVADLSPKPRLEQGSIKEIIEIIDPFDLSGFTQALSLKTGSNKKVIINALLVGNARREQLLRSTAGAGDHLIRLNCDNATPAEITSAVRTLEVVNQYDLITIGSVCLNGEQGTGAYLAGALARTHYRKTRLLARPDGMGLEHIAPPAVLSITDVTDPSEQDLNTTVAATFAHILVINPSIRSDVARAPRYERPAGVAAANVKITTVQAAAEYIYNYAAKARSARAEEYYGEIVRGRLSDDHAIWAILDPFEQNANSAILRAGRGIADGFGRSMNAVIAAPRGSWPKLLGLARANGADGAFCLDTANSMLSIEGKEELLRMITKTSDKPLVLGGAYWLDVFGVVSGQLAAAGRHVHVYGNVASIVQQGDRSITLSMAAYDNRLIRKERLQEESAFMTIPRDAEFSAQEMRKDLTAVVLDYPLEREWLMPLPPAALPSLALADTIIDVGYGIRDRAGFELALELKKILEARGLVPLLGATRKVTQDLKLLPLEAQIGQTGIRVNPKLIIALGISGAPQHIDYVGTRAEILCFNKDPDAPLMKLTRPAPRVHPIVGDLFVTVRALIERLK